MGLTGEPLWAWRSTRRPPRGAAASGRRCGGHRRAAERPTLSGRAGGARRARAKIRRYCAAQPAQPPRDADLRGEGCYDPRLRADVAGFFRGLRGELGGGRCRTCGCRSGIQAGTGCTCTSRSAATSQRLIEQAWGRGLVHIKLIGDLPVGSGALEEARLAASYLARYVGARTRGPAAPAPAPVRGRAGLPAGADPVLGRSPRTRSCGPTR